VFRVHAYYVIIHRCDDYNNNNISPKFIIEIDYRNNIKVAYYSLKLKPIIVGIQLIFVIFIRY